MGDKLQILVISDGKPGHENQSLGLADAMARLRPAEIRTMRLDQEKGVIGRILQAREGIGKPDYVVAAGHSTNLPLIFAARRSGAHSIVLMKPGLPMSWFGTCIVPEHDFTVPPVAPYVITSKGALNRVMPAHGDRSGKIILVGGPSKTHGYDEEALVNQIQQIAHEGGWEIADSRRTPRTFLPAIEKAVSGIAIHRHQETKPGWLAERLSSAQKVWVTEDSVSMIYEALTGGARVGVLEMPRLRPGARVIRGLDTLAKEGYIGTDRQPAPLAEADRCAEIILSNR